MKTKKLLFCFSFFIFSFSICEGQSWVWGAQGKCPSPSYAEGYNVAIDKSDNAYTIGFISGTLILGTDTFTTNNTQYAVYLIKYDSSGNLLWSAHSKGCLDGRSTPGSVATDANENVYITGEFRDTIVFNQDSIKTTSTNQYPFLTKYDAYGNVLWANAPLGNGFGAGTSISTDIKNHEYVTGEFNNAFEFGIDTLRAIGTNIFLAKYDTNGNVLWAKQGYQPNSSCSVWPMSVTNDMNGNVFVTGYFQDTLEFGPLTLYCSVYDVFIVKYDSSGNILWAKQGAIHGTGGHGFCYGAATDLTGNTYLTGYFQDTIYFGSHILINDTRNPNMFITKYDPNGNVIWAKAPNVNDTNGWIGYSLSIDTLGHLYCVASPMGNYYYHVYFYYGTDTFSFYNLIVEAGIIFQLDTAGNLQCASLFQVGDDVNGVASDPTGKYVYCGSDLESTLPYYIFGQDTLTSSGSGGEYPFVARWQPYNNNTEGTNELTSQKNSLSLFPNPNNGIFTIQSSLASNRLTVEIYNMMGEKVFSMYNAQLSIVNSPLSIDLGSQPSGIYLYRVMDENGKLIGSGKFVVEK